MTGKHSIQHAPTCCNGALTSPGDITLIHNGVLVLDRAVPRVRNDHCQPGHDGNERLDHVAGSRGEWADDGHALPQHLVQTADADEVKATYELRDPIKAL